MTSKKHKITYKEVKKMSDPDIHGNVKLYKRPNPSSHISRTYYDNHVIKQMIIDLKEIKSQINTMSGQLTKLVKQTASMQVQYKKQRDLIHANNSHYETIYEDFIQIYFLLLEEMVANQPLCKFLHRPDHGLGKEGVVMGYDRKDQKRTDETETPHQELSETENQRETEQQREAEQKSEKTQMPFGLKHLEKNTQDHSEKKIKRDNNPQEFRQTNEITFRDIQKATSIYSVPMQGKKRTTIRRNNSQTGQQPLQKMELNNKPIQLQHEKPEMKLDKNVHNDNANKTPQEENHLIKKSEKQAQPLHERTQEKKHPANKQSDLQEQKKPSQQEQQPESTSLFKSFWNKFK